MLAALRRGCARIAIAALYALAMMTLGMAHPPASQHLPSAELAQYALPDGSFPVLCSGDSGSTDEDPTVLKPACCDACTLITGPGVVGASPVVGSAQLVLLRRFSLAGYAYRPVVRASDNFLSRAPPRMT